MKPNVLPEESPAGIEPFATRLESAANALERAAKTLERNFEKLTKHHRDLEDLEVELDQARKRGASRQAAENLNTLETQRGMLQAQIAQEEIALTQQIVALRRLFNPAGELIGETGTLLLEEFATKISSAFAPYFSDLATAKVQARQTDAYQALFGQIRNHQYPPLSNDAPSLVAGAAATVGFLRKILGGEDVLTFQGFGSPAASTRRGAVPSTSPTPATV